MLHIKNAYIKVMVVFAFTVLLVLAVNLPVAAAAAASASGLDVLEASQVRVVINGVAGSYTDVALEINDRIMLPFRELLTKLGVANDDEHIIWNEEEESVTVLYGENTVKLQIGNYNMSVNDVEKTYDVAPFFYEKNDRTYIPVRAVSELLDKEIMWEEATSTVYVRDKANYAETVALLERMQNAGQETKIRATSDSIINYRITTDSGPIPGSDEDGVLRMKMSMSQQVTADLEKNVYNVKQSSNINNIPMNTEVYFYNNRAFVKIDTPGSDWQDAGDIGVNVGAPTNQIMFMESQINARPLSDVAMGMAVTKGPDGTYSLTGEPLSFSDINVIGDTLTSVLQQSNLSGLEMKFNKLQFGTTIDSQYKPVKTVALMDFEFSIKEQIESEDYITIIFNADVNMTINYDRTDMDFTIEIPQEILDLM